MKILLIASYPESLIAFRGPLIEALVAYGASVCVAAPGLTKEDWVCNELQKLGATYMDVPMGRTGVNPFQDVITLVGLFRCMRAVKPDVTLGYTVKPVIYGSIAAKLAGVPERYALVTGLGYAFTGGAESFKRRFLQVVVRTLYRVALGTATKVLFQNPDDESLFRQLGLVPESVATGVVNGSGVDTNAFRFSPAITSPMSFLLIARLLGDKGVREFVEAGRRVKALHPEAELHLVGWIDDNPDAISREELDRWVNEGLLTFHGKLRDVQPVIKSSSVYVLPSYREGTPRTVLEAMAVGRPIITTDAPGCRETVVDGENGYLVKVKSASELAEAMLNFIRRPELVVSMGKRSREIAEQKYEVDKVNRQMLSEMGLN